MISQEAMQKFKELWKKKKGEDISDEFAADEFRNLLTLFNAIYRPVKKEWLDEFPEITPNQKS
ncbi:MAG: hypothetical protein NTZ84_03415 [Candidatus Nealsonbacteria bacterium]|nr:hypothetical protein [Candidatus Nealsonbacteria bacterium]